MPFAAEMAQSHSVTGFHHTETVFTNWFYPQNSELLHAVGILLTERDTLSLFLNFGWLAVAFLAAWCIGRPYGRGPPQRRRRRDPARVPHAGRARARRGEERPRWPRRCSSPRSRSSSTPGRRGETGDAEAAPAGRLAAGRRGARGRARRRDQGDGAGDGGGAERRRDRRWRRRAGAGRRRAGGSCRPCSAAATGTCATSIVAGNPLPQVESLGPISLPHPERLQIGRPDFSIAPLRDRHRRLARLLRPRPARRLRRALAAGRRRRDRRRRCWRCCGAATGSCAGSAAVALFGIARLPVHAAQRRRRRGRAGRLRDQHPLRRSRRCWPALVAAAARRACFDGRAAPVGRCSAALLVVLVLTDRADAVLRDPARALRAARRAARGRWSRPALLLRAPARRRAAASSPAAFAALALAVVAIGYPVQRHYLDDRFAQRGADEASPAWTSTPPTAGRADSRTPASASPAPPPASSGTASTAPTSPTRPLPRRRGPARRLQRDPDLRRLPRRRQRRRPRLPGHRALPQLHPPGRARSPRPRRAGCAASRRSTPILRSGPVTVWRVRGRLDPAACGPAQRAAARDPRSTPAS